ncbi:MAG: NAD(P)/FAD-dependent oxidoreductase [Ruminococcaceae bacterium]|nr:NAD(P)/FAD-dependent oxidoreductase [Oscillospiraceae bacterium]
MKNYDVIVVGAGMGGLACAGVLAKNNKRVLLLEQSHSAGGFANSFVRGRFEFEVSLHELCGFGRYDMPFGPVRGLFNYLGISDKIDWVDIPDAYRLITFNDENRYDIRMPFGIKEYIDKLEEYVPGSKKEVTRLFQAGEDVRKEIEALSAPMGTLKKIFALLKNGVLLHTASYSMNEVLDTFDLPTKAKDILRAYWAYLCTDLDTLDFIHYIQMLNSYIELKAVVPRLRSHEMVNCLVDCFREYGGTIRLNSKVTKINTLNGAVTGVELDDGTAFSAETVVCNCSPHNVFGKMIDKKDVPEYEVKKANARTFGGRGFCVFLGLNKSADELGLKDYSYFIYPNMDTVKEFKRMALPETNDVQNTVCLNAVNPQASPEGTCMLCMTTLFTSDYWGKVSPENYYEEKEKFALHMIDVFEKATGVRIRDNIEEIEIATPATFARFTDATDGVIYGYLGKKNDGVVARRMDKSGNSVKGLHFAGGYGHMLLGYSSALSSGRTVAHNILSDTEAANK